MDNTHAPTHKSTAAAEPFANMPLAEAKNTSQQAKAPIMKREHYLRSKINAMHQAKWVRAALMTLALLVAVLGVTACGHPH